MGEGSIEGRADEYEVAEKYSTDFKYYRYERHEFPEAGEIFL